MTLVITNKYKFWQILQHKTDQRWNIADHIESRDNYKGIIFKVVFLDFLCYKNNVL